MAGGLDEDTMYDQRLFDFFKLDESEDDTRRAAVALEESALFVRRLLERGTEHESLGKSRKLRI